MRLRFGQKLELVRALVIVPIDDDVWNALKLINFIRNDLAHNLEPPKLADHLSSAKQLAAKFAMRPAVQSKPILVTDAEAIRYLTGFAQGYLEAVDSIVALMETQRSYPLTPAQKTMMEKCFD